MHSDDEPHGWGAHAEDGELDKTQWDEALDAGYDDLLKAMQSRGLIEEEENLWDD